MFKELILVAHIIGGDPPMSIYPDSAITHLDYQSGIIKMCLEVEGIPLPKMYCWEAERTLDEMNETRNKWLKDSSI